LHFVELADLGGVGIARSRPVCGGPEDGLEAAGEALPMAAGTSFLQHFAGELARGG